MAGEAGGVSWTIEVCSCGNPSARFGRCPLDFRNGDGSPKEPGKHETRVVRVVERPAQATIGQAAAALEAEVEKRNEWYGLDNWSFDELIVFCLAAVDQVPKDVAVELAQAARQLVNAPLPPDLDRERPFWVAARNVRATLSTYAELTGVDGEQERRAP